MPVESVVSLCGFYVCSVGYKVKHYGGVPFIISRMKRREKMKNFLVLTACFAFVGIATGQDKTFSFSESLQRYTWDLGPEISYIKYEEPDVMEEEGMMYGIMASCTYRGWVQGARLLRVDTQETPKGKFMLRGDGKFSFGYVDYDGALCYGTPYTIDNIEDYMFEFRYLVGYDFPEKTTMTTPYIGIGYRYLNDDLSCDPLGYERESNYIYCPIGIENITFLGNDWLIGGTAEFDLFLYGLQRSHLGYYYGTIENRQKEGYGVRGSVRFQKKGKGIGCSIEPFIRYWWIDDSDSEYFYYEEFYEEFWEPENNSTEYGVRLVVKF